MLEGGIPIRRPTDLHLLSLVHTDMKPANIMMRSSETKIVLGAEEQGITKVSRSQKERRTMLTCCRSNLYLWNW